MLKNSVITLSNSINKKRILLFGVGWLGKELIHSLLDDEHILHIVTRDNSKWSNFDAKIEQIHVYTDTNELDPSIKNLSFDLVCVMLPPSSFDGYEEVIKWICKQTLEVKHFIYTSSTSVYKANDGVVNEESMVDEQNIVYKAEQEIKKVFPNRFTILRLSGLISEDRHPTKYLLRKEMINEGSSPVNLVHRKDVIRAIQILTKMNGSGEVFNLSYPDHPSRKEYYGAFAKKYFGQTLCFIDDGNGKTIDGSKFAMKYEYKYEMSIWDVELNNR